jgi:phosphomevalonate kinase
MMADDAYASALALLIAAANPEACRERIEELQNLHAAIERDRAALVADRAEHDRAMARFKELERLEIQANSAVEVLRRVLREYRETREAAALDLPNNFGAELAAIFRDHGVGLQ